MPSPLAPLKALNLRGEKERPTGGPMGEREVCFESESGRPIREYHMDGVDSKREATQSDSPIFFRQNS